MSDDELRQELLFPAEGTSKGMNGKICFLNFLFFESASDLEYICAFSVCVLFRFVVLYMHCVR